MIRKIYEQLKVNRRVRQVFALFSVNIIGIPIGIITSIVVTGYLGAEDYGDYKFILSIFNFAIIIFTFGFFHAGNRALVLTSDSEKSKEYYGAELLISGALYILMSIALIIYAMNDQNIEEKGLSRIILIVIPFGFVFLFKRYFETLFQADNQIRGLAQVRLYPKLGFLITAGFVYFVFIQMNFNKLAIILFFFIGTELVSYLLVLSKINISFRNIKQRLTEIWQYNKSFGLNVYIGSLFSLGFSSLNPILISYFGVDNSGVGFYALALTFASPLSFIPNTIATTHYKDFSKSKKVSRKILLSTIIISLAALIILWIIIGPFVKFFYGAEFEPVMQLNYIVSLGVIAHGFGDFFNRYLGANGQGKALRNSSFVVGGSMLLLSLLLIPEYGEFGAAYAKLWTGVIYTLIIIIYYFRYLKAKANE